jgi:hypothetical protein
MYSPIALFAFNRPVHLRRTLEALAANELAAESHITIFCDGPRTEEEKIKTDAVRTIARAAQGFASVKIVERDHNMGCAASIIDGLTEMFTQYERLIVIEDDVVSSPYTLAFLNKGLNFYEQIKNVFSVSAWSIPEKTLHIPKKYEHDVYAVPRFNGSGGWASWRDRFQNIDWAISDYAKFKQSPAMRRAFNEGGDDLSAMLDMQIEGKIDAWDIRADYARFKQRQVGINPVFSYTTNIGMDSGTHCTDGCTRFDNDISLAKKEITLLSDVSVDKRVRKAYCAVYADNRSLLRRWIAKVCPSVCKKYIKKLLHMI